jgi:hypothetical protein
VRHRKTRLNGKRDAVFFFCPKNCFCHSKRAINKTNDKFFMTDA